MRVETRDTNGVPICPVCSTEVDKAGTFCGSTCYQHFITVVSSQPGMVEMEQLVDLESMPWYSQGNGSNTETA